MSSCGMSQLAGWQLGVQCSRLLAAVLTCSLGSHSFPHEGCGFLDALDGPLDGAAWRQEEQDAACDWFLCGRVEGGGVCG